MIPSAEPPASAPTQPALFLDRDGTIIVHRPYLFKPDEVEILPGVPETLRRAREAGFKLFLFTNQSGVGRGYFTLADVHAVHRRMIELLGLGADVFTAICIAPEHPDEPAVYRKPSPRFVEESIARWGLDRRRCWMIGDTAVDWQTGMNAGITSLAVRSDLSTEESERQRQAWRVPLFPDLAAAFGAMDLTANPAVKSRQVPA